jgi:hypothetical protein
VPGAERLPDNLLADTPVRPNTVSLMTPSYGPNMLWKPYHIAGPPAASPRGAWSAETAEKLPVLLPLPHVEPAYVRTNHPNGRELVGMDRQPKPVRISRVEQLAPVENITDEGRVERSGNLAHKCHTVGARARFVNVWSN